MIRAASRYAWRHSAAGWTVWVIRRRSTFRPPDGLVTGMIRSVPEEYTATEPPSPETAYPSSLSTSVVRVPLARSKCSSEGRPEVSSGPVKVWPKVPEIGQRSQTTPPRTASVAEYLEAITGNWTSRLEMPCGSTVTVPSPLPAPAVGTCSGRPSVGAANGEGVSAASGTRYGRQPSGKDMSPVCTSCTGSKPRQERKTR